MGVPAQNWAKVDDFLKRSAATIAEHDRLNAVAQPLLPRQGEDDEQQDLRRTASH